MRLYILRNRFSSISNIQYNKNFLIMHAFHSSRYLQSKWMLVFSHASMVKVRKVAKVRNRYNQVPHLTQDTTWESDKNTIKYHKQEPRGQPFPAGDHKAAMNNRENIKNTRHK